MGRREDFMAALAPLQNDSVPPLHRDLKQLFPTDEAFRKWEDSLWLGLFFARRLTGVLAEQPRVESKSPAGRIQSFLEVAQGEGAFFGPQSLLHDLPLAIRRTCCVRIDEKAAGTGFLVGADLVLTNWHVVRSILKPEEHPERLSVAFDYLHEAGVGEPPLAMHASKITRWRPARPEFLPDTEPSPRPLDYAVIRLSAALPTERGFFDLGKTPDLATGSRVVIVGHPGGQPLAVSFSRSVGLHGLDDALAYYDADTLHGSSGSLVLLESQNQLKAALLHAGGKTADENFGIHLKAINADLEGVVTEAPAPAKPKPKLEGFFGADSDQRAGQLATLLSVLPSDVKLDTSASVSQQIKSLESQWDDRFTEALEIARAVAAPASASAIASEVRTDERVESGGPDSKPKPPPWLRPKVWEAIIGAAVVVGLALWIVPKLFDSKKSTASAANTCGLTKQSLSAPTESEFRCDSVFVKTSARVECELSSPEGSIHGQCEHWLPIGRWTSRDAAGKVVWEVDFAKGLWTIPYRFHGYDVTATEEHDGAGNVVRTMVLPTGARAIQDSSGTQVTCGAAFVEVSGRDRDLTTTAYDGEKLLVVAVESVTFDGKQIVRSLVNDKDLTMRLGGFGREVEQCHAPKLVEPICNAGTWATDCQTTSAKPCYKHTDTAATIDELACGATGLNEKPDTTANPFGIVGAITNQGCTSLTQCVSRLRPTTPVTPRPIKPPIVTPGPSTPGPSTPGPSTPVIPRPLTPRPLAPGTFEPLLAVHPYVKTLQQRVSFPIEQCKSAQWKPQPEKVNDKWVVSAKCVCADTKQTPLKVVASFVDESHMPDGATLKARFKALGNQCP